MKRNEKNLHNPKIVEQLAPLGLDTKYLAYKPVIRPGEENIFAMGQEAWEKSMIGSFGSSSAGSVLGESKYKTKDELVMEKAGLLGSGFPQDLTTRYLTGFGHMLEEIGVKVYAWQMGYEVALTDERNPATSTVKDWSEVTEEELEAYKADGKSFVCTDHARYRHPEHENIHTDMDAIAVHPDGTWHVIEVKTASTDGFEFEWHEGVWNWNEVERATDWRSAKVKNPGYVAQAAHHMMVTNTDRCDIVALCDNNINRVCIIRVDRNLAYEKKLLEATQDAIQKMEELKLKGYEVDFKKLRDSSLENLSTMIINDTVDEAKKDDRSFILPEEARALVNEYLEYSFEKKELAKMEKEIAEKQNAILVNLIPFMEGYSFASMPSEIEGKTIYLETKDVTKTSFDKKKLALDEPEIFAKYSSEVLTGAKKLTIKEKKTMKA